ncbi:uncharacterized protein B0I36DRAFT_149026 [Microdochium trichocladiopsis]|uniref:FHA domain-containing protein n=1 Tax=Microdochium trichocladiopsis TaxID=1682393 RepID=A0A9P9BMF1_9PEZI|nr:uncharacterized protein B0I36DRAFT_149026 [Microdochium trichocladiopsis]KAH7025781.1 hypothetical protein B0I36DRAFT_149026 [Microdochium trichocladiopsis]
MDAPSSGQGQSKASDGASPGSCATSRNTTKRSPAMLLVTLNVSRGNHAQQTTRRLVFTPEKPVICVGRASKVTSKGFVASEANAFFESPVMSRQHAELLANFDDKSISIKDSGSLHGTFYTSIDTASEIQLAAGQAQKLSHQDVLRFGINIFRSEITHPPTIVSVEISEEQRRSAISRLTPTNKFSVPDDVDSDDAMSDGEEGDDDSVVETPQPPRNNNVNIKTVDLTQEEPTNVIDLTTDLDRTIVIDDPEISRIDVVSVDEADVDAEHDLPVLWDSDDESSIHSDMSDKDSDVDSIEEDDESILCSEIDDMDDEDIEEEGGKLLKTI